MRTVTFCTSVVRMNKSMAIKEIIPQLRTTDMESTIRFYTEKLGFEVQFNYEDFYVGLASGGRSIHVKCVDDIDPSIPYVDEGGHLHLYFETEGVAEFAERLKHKDVEFVEDVHETAWSTREIVIRDDQGHTLYFGEAL